MTDSLADHRPLILVVDDDWMNREVIEAHLLGAGYRAMLAHNGERALEMAFAEPPDLVLLDVRMHGISGYEVCAALKAHSATKYAPVVMVTALESEEDKLRAIQAGADDFISKPFTSLMLLTRVKSLLRIKRLHDELEERNALLRRVLNRYVNEEIAETILADPERRLRLGGETRPVTVMFADIRGFTAFAELHPAGEVLSLLNHFFNEMTEVIFRHHGTLDKYVGDEIMALFGAPVVVGDDTLNAARAALTMQQMFERLKSGIPGEDVARLGLGIGLHSGDAAIGNVGSERFMSYTVIGDTVNMAHRLQEEAPSGVVLISAATYALIAPHVVVTRLDPVRIKGKREPQIVYRLDGMR